MSNWSQCLVGGVLQSHRKCKALNAGSNPVFLAIFKMKVKPVRNPRLRCLGLSVRLKAEYLEDTKEEMSSRETDTVMMHGQRAIFNICKIDYCYCNPTCYFIEAMKKHCTMNLAWLQRINSDCMWAEK